VFQDTKKLSEKPLDLSDKQRKKYKEKEEITRYHL